jgi:hypothetical protein
MEPALRTPSADLEGAPRTIAEDVGGHRVLAFSNSLGCHGWQF